ncbi:MAG: response regulator, partial [Thermodesulfobacteriota bacterium]
MNKDKIKVLIVDDSAVVRQALTSILESDPDIEVMDVAADPYIAAKKLEKEVPDVITLDIEMPRMDGITFLQKLMQQHPIPVLVCSSLTESGSETAIQAMEAGAVDIITKPRMGAKQFLEESRIKICDGVKAVASADVGKMQKSSRSAYKVPPRSNADAVSVGEPVSRAMASTTEKIVVVGASTGGTEAIREFLEGMPVNAPGIAIVQHMPEQFTSAFAQRLDMLCSLAV